MLIETVIFAVVCSATIWIAARLARTRSDGKDIGALVGSVGLPNA